MPSNSLHLDNYQLDVLGDIHLDSGGQMYLSAKDESGEVHILGRKSIALTGGGSAVILSDSSVHIGGAKKVRIGGGKGIAGTIELAMDGVTIELTPLVRIKLSPTGVEIAAGASKFTVGVAGIDLSAPVITQKAEAANKVDDTLVTNSAKAVRDIGATFTTLG